ncbi:hypothetical protein MRB53_040012 [Persea americana]|nr:hypothetical protein MRB53_040012 [Persea americana]
MKQRQITIVNWLEMTILKPQSAKSWRELIYSPQKPLRLEMNVKGRVLGLDELEIGVDIILTQVTDLLARAETAFTNPSSFTYFDASERIRSTLSTGSHQSIFYLGDLEPMNFVLLYLWNISIMVQSGFSEPSLTNAQF